jgi:glycosyltransferase involved in cell wall biosynthesis
VTTGEQLRETLVRDNGFPAASITSVPTGIDTERYRPGDKIQARKILGIDPDARYVGIVATLRSWKGHLYLIDAFARLAAEDPRLRLVIVGDGPMQDPIRQKVAELGLASRSVLAGRQDAVETWLQALDVFCLPSYANEGVPQALLQAMLTALPIVTTPVGSIREAVTDGVTGLIVPPRNVDALAVALRRLLDDNVLARRLAEAAREHAANRFGIDTMLDRMEQIFREVAGDGASSGRQPA